MTTVLTRGRDENLLTGWARQSDTARSIDKATRRCVINVVAGLRFAFYRRMSTHDLQDPATSRQWQRSAAEDVLAGHGWIVAEYFDLGYSRRRSWHGRPQAAALLATLKSLYLREDRVLARLAADLGQAEADPRGLASYLHAEQITITCDPSWIKRDGPR